MLQKKIHEKRKTIDSMLFDAHNAGNGIFQKFMGGGSGHAPRPSWGKGAPYGPLSGHSRLLYPFTGRL